MWGAPLSYGVFSCKAPLSCGWVLLEASCQTENLTTPETAVTVMISFYNSEGNWLRRQNAKPTPASTRGRLNFSRLFEVPAGTVFCTVELALRWPRSGRVVFDHPVLSAAEPPSERSARVVVTYFHHKKTEMSMYDRIKQIFVNAESCGPDLICFSEMLPLRGLPFNPQTLAEPVDGRFVTLLSQLSQKYHTYTVGNFLELDGSEFFNTSVLLDRNGGLAGRYRKTHLPLSEVEGGSSPGDSYPVFQTDFARVGMLICWDLSFPEPMRNLRDNGAELVINSTAGDFWPQDMVRSQDNGVWLATAGTSRNVQSPYPPSRIYDPTGSLIAAADNDGADTIAYADIDFNRRYYRYWASVGPCEGEPSSLYAVERRPETY